MIYLNNAATSYPKPDSVIKAVTNHLKQRSYEPGRGNEENTRDILATCRQNLGELFNIKDINRIILTSGSTIALNYAIYGLARSCPDATCLTSTMEHNSVLRPLNHIAKQRNLTINYLSTNRFMETFAQTLNKSITFVVVNHVSNVTGTILPIKEIAFRCADLNIPVIIDASQSAGSLEINLQDFPDNIILVLTGHKGLMGPMGTGAFYLGKDIELFEPIIQGGTGIRSDLPMQPYELPLYYESGTMNLPGFAGLAEGVAFVNKTGVHTIGYHKHQLFSLLKETIAKPEELILHEPLNKNYSCGVFSFSIRDWSPMDIGIILQQSFGIITRTGLHCAPLIHHEIGTWPLGSVRLSCSWFTSEEEINKTAHAINMILRSKK